jgi:hypothetical protein
MFLLPCFLQGQITVYNSSLRDTTKNELYCGLENDIVINGINEKDYTAKISSGRLNKISGFVYRVIPICIDEKNQQNDTVFIYKKGKLVFSRVFIGKVYCWDNPYFQLGSRKDSLLSVQEIVASPTLKIKYLKCNYKNQNPLHDVVNGFNIQIQSQQTKEVLYSREIQWWDFLSSEDIKEIKKLQSGDKIIFSEIKTIGAGSCGRYLEGQLVFQIK